MLVQFLSSVLNLTHVPLLIEKKKIVKFTILVFSSAHFSQHFFMMFSLFTVNSSV